MTSSFTPEQREEIRQIVAEVLRTDRDLLGAVEQALMDGAFKWAADAMEKEASECAVTS